MADLRTRRRLGPCGCLLLGAGCLVGLATGPAPAGQAPAAPKTTPRPVPARPAPERLPPPAAVVAPAPAVPPGAPGPLPLTLNEAVAWALRNSPELAAFRQQRGVAAAGLVIARTYPFNPTWEDRVQGNSGPISAGITNRVSLEELVLLELEIRNQGQYRRQGARATLARTNWEILQQEVTLAIRVIRAFNGVLYQLEKLQLVRQTVAINQEALRQVDALVRQGRLTDADLLSIRTELESARALLPFRTTALVPVVQELYRAMGVVTEHVRPVGDLATPLRAWDRAALTEAALTQRPDVHARQAAVAEAEATLRLTVANRYGNPVVGPAYTYDPTRVSEVGAQINLPLPVLNTHEGEILRDKALRQRAVYDLRQTEVAVQQDVRAALARYAAARALVDSYRNRVIPDLEAAVRRMNVLLRGAVPGVDALKIIDLNRKLLTARDAELDARWELNQALADLAAAVGDPAVALPALPVGVCPH